MLALGSNAASASAPLYPWDCHVQSQFSHLERRHENARLTGMLKEFKRGKSLCEDRHVRALRKCLGGPCDKSICGLRGTQTEKGHCG